MGFGGWPLRQSGHKVVIGGGGVVGVEHGDAVRVFVLGGMDHRPGSGVGQIRCLVIGAGSYRVAGQDHQLGVHGVGAGQPVLQLDQGVTGQGVEPV